MHVLALQGSPRLGYNTDTLLNALLSELPTHSVTKHNVSELKILPCLSCYACASETHCPISDDMCLLYPGLARAEIVIMASPIYFYSFSSQLKSVVDRCQAFWTNPLSRESGRKGVLLLTGGAKDLDGLGRETATNTARIFFDCIGAPLTHTLAVMNTDIEPVAIQAEAVRKAQELGRLISSLNQNT